MEAKRFARLSNGFSKKLENHVAAVGLYVAHYNLCRVHEALRITPAMQLGITDHIWTIGELVDAALEGTLPEQPGRRVGPQGLHRKAMKTAVTSTTTKPGTQIRVRLC